MLGRARSVEHTLLVKQQTTDGLKSGFPNVACNKAQFCWPDVSCSKKGGEVKLLHKYVGTLIMNYFS